MDRVLDEVARLLRDHPHEVVVDSRITAQRTFWSDAQYRDTGRFKFNDLYLFSELLRSVALDSLLASLLRDLLGEAPVLCNTLNLIKGSSDHLHIDSLFMTPRTPGALVATWIALEDVHPSAGPLTYFPGSHNIPLHHFSDGSRHANRAEMPSWLEYIQRELRQRGIDEQIFHGKKGDVFIWHSDLVHAGSPITDPRRTRKSLVCHYFGEADARAQQADLVTQGKSFWLQRDQQPVLVPPDVFKLGRVFPEATYMRRYPDVNAAVKSGAFRSGYLHYEMCGFKEGRGV